MDKISVSYGYFLTSMHNCFCDILNHYSLTLTCCRTASESNSRFFTNKL